MPKAAEAVKVWSLAVLRVLLLRRRLAGCSPQSALGLATLVQVVVRCRPLNGKEKQDGRERIVDMDVRAGQVTVSSGGAYG